MPQSCELRSTCRSPSTPHGLLIGDVQTVLRASGCCTWYLLLLSGVLLHGVACSGSRTRPVLNQGTEQKTTATATTAEGPPSAGAAASAGTPENAGQLAAAGTSHTTGGSVDVDSKQPPSQQLAHRQSLPTDAKSATASLDEPAHHPAASSSDEVADNSRGDKKFNEASAAGDWSSMPRQRWLLLAEGGPVLVDWVVQIDGRWWPDVLSDFYESAGKIIGLNTEKSVRWVEVIERSILRGAGMFESSMPADIARQMSRVYDRNGDSQVQEPELVEYLKSHPNFRGTFQLNPRSMRRQRAASTGTTIWDALDGDQDGLLDAAEWRQVAVVLPHYDADDDESVSYEELHSPSEIFGPLMEPDPIRTPSKVIALNEIKDWAGMLYQLEEHYSLGLPLVPGCWNDKELFVHLDHNGDGRIGEEEVRRICDVPPHVVLLIAWEGRQPMHAADNAGDSSTAPQVTCVAVPRGGPIEIEPVEGAAAEWVCRGIGGDAMLLRLVENVTPVDRLTETFWESSDRDRNDYLDEQEFQLISARTTLVFGSVDADGDTKIFRQELQAALRDFCVVANVQIQAEVSQNDDRLFFVLDANHDGRLTLREISNATRRLQALDRNDDGKLELKELPTWWQVTLIHGAGDTARVAAQVPRPPLKPAGAIEWFSAMDRNADGDISPREFLGPIELFEALDRDGDKLLSADEATKAPVTLPPAGDR